MREPGRSPALSEVGAEDMRLVRGGEQQGGPTDGSGEPQVATPPPPPNG